MCGLMFLLDFRPIELRRPPTRGVTSTAEKCKKKMPITNEIEIEIEIEKNLMPIITNCKLFSRLENIIIINDTF
jgi:hypothetical protein